MNKIELINNAFDMADKLQSDLPVSQYEVPALTSLRIRHLLNNLGKAATRYLEIGVHRGGTFTASIAGNENLKFIYAIDSFYSDSKGELALPDFNANVLKFKPTETDFKLIVADSFEVVLDEIKEPIDHYLYDGDHSYESQKKALTYYYPILADEFIYMVDDWDWKEVSKGTADGIKDCGLEVIYERIVKGNNHDNDSWWNGFAVYVLKKK